MGLGYTPRWLQVRIIETLLAVKRTEDWSKVRSPGRARRRRSRRRQNIVVRDDPAAYELRGVLYIHPSLAIELRRHAAATFDRRMPNVFYGVPHGT